MQYRLKINPAIFEKFPSYCAQVIYVEGVLNGVSDAYSTNILRTAEQEARAQYQEHSPSEHEHIRAWQQAFTQFGAKPKKYLCSAEALLKRAVSGNEIPAINRVVDIYNAVSIRWAIPAGGEDWDRLQSDLTLTSAAGSEPFITRNANGEQIDFPKSGEIIWADEAGATVRMWNWRQCYRTRVTEETRNIYFVLDRLEPYPRSSLFAATDELCNHLLQLSPQCRIQTEIFEAARTV